MIKKYMNKLKWYDIRYNVYMPNIGSLNHVYEQNTVIFIAHTLQILIRPISQYYERLKLKCSLEFYYYQSFSLLTIDAFPIILIQKPCILMKLKNFIV